LRLIEAGIYLGLGTPGERAEIAISVKRGEGVYYGMKLSEVPMMMTEGGYDGFEWWWMG
jgi:hypothetical protein